MQYKYSRNVKIGTIFVFSQDKAMCIFSAELPLKSDPPSPPPPTFPPKQATNCLGFLQENDARNVIQLVLMIFGRSFRRVSAHISSFLLDDFNERATVRACVCVFVCLCVKQEQQQNKHIPVLQKSR